MATNFESVYAALFTKVTNSSGFVTKSRKLKLVQDVPVGSMPAIFQMQKHERVTQSRGLPAVWRCLVDIYIYSYNSDNYNSGSQSLNNLIGAVRDALAPDICTGFQTLGDTVSHCWISEMVEIFEGVQENVSVAVIPVEFLINQ